MNGSSQVVNAAVVAAVIAAGVSVIGFFVNQFSVRRERRSKTFADAMAALTRWSQLPYAVLQRTDSTPQTRKALGQEITRKN